MHKLLDILLHFYRPRFFKPIQTTISMSNTHKHWANYLPFVGRPIQRIADAQELLAMRIADAKSKLAQLEKEYATQEAELKAIVAQDWTPQEIADAKSKAQPTQPSTHEEREPYFV